MDGIFDGIHLENVYPLQIKNATESAHAYQIKINGLKGLYLSSDVHVTVKATSVQSVPISLRLPGGDIEVGMHAIQFEVSAEGIDAPVLENSIFYMTQ